MRYSEEMEYFFAELDFHLREGESALDALVNATEDYRYVFLEDDGRLPLGRAATVALKQMKEKEVAHD